MTHLYQQTSVLYCRLSDFLWPSQKAWNLFNFSYTETSPILLPHCVSYSLLVLLLKFYYERRRRSCVGPLSRFLLFPKVVVYKSCAIFICAIQNKHIWDRKMKVCETKKNYNIEADLIWLRIKVDLQLNRQTTGFKMRCLFARNI